jgi:Ca2+-binding EF-hand superfamily protein
MKRMTLGLSIAALILASAGYAAEEHMRAAQPETRADARARAEHLFDKLDLNHDGKLDKADRAIRINEMFDRFDANHDGAISRDEFAAAHEHMHEHMMDHDQPGPGPGHPDKDRAGHPDGDDHGGHMGHWGHDHREPGGLVMLILQRADPGHTGTVSRDGFVGAALSLFDQADTNHDGILTPDEHRAAAQAMGQHMRAEWQQHGGPSGDSPPPPPPPAH